MDLKESWIEEQAVNASALKNGKAIYQSGKFIKLYHSQDDTFYMGECSGSGSKNYITLRIFRMPHILFFAVTALADSFHVNTVSAFYTLS